MYDFGNIVHLLLMSWSALSRTFGIAFLDNNSREQRVVAVFHNTGFQVQVMLELIKIRQK